jgi:hypothetical protein
MTRNDFEVIAEVLASSAPVNPANKVLADFHRATCEAFAARLKSINPRFDRAKFLRACGV